MGIELKTKTGNITLTTPKASSGGSVDLSNYYTKAQVDELIPDTSLFVTGEYVQTSINESLPDLTPYAKKSDIPSLDGYAKTEDIPDVSGFITETELTAMGYQTEAEVNTLISNALAEIGVAEEGAY